MDDSLSSDLFSDAADQNESFSAVSFSPFNSLPIKVVPYLTCDCYDLIVGREEEQEECVMMTCHWQKERFDYGSVLAATKAALSSYSNEINISTIPTFFDKVLEDCWSCISHSLEDLIRGLLADTSVPLIKIAKYLTESACLLHMLSEFYKSLVLTVPLSCLSMKILPAKTGRIILTVFLHCRDSESLYGQYLKNIENQLKDLFRICHELQLTYLTILEKHFVLNLDEMEDKEVLVTALKINLTIGNVVQSLDVKTMAEQWKGYTAICDKYSSYLIHTDIFQESVRILCASIKNNIESALEHNQDCVRCLKVTGFTIKILLKTYNILRQSTNKNFSEVVELFRYICVINARFLQLSAEQSFSSLFNNNVMMTSEILLKEMLLDNQFVNCLIDSFSPLNGGKVKDGENLVASLLLITATMKCASQMNRRLPNDLKTNLVTSIYSLLPYCHIWLHRRLRFTECPQARHGMLQHALILCATLATSMNNEEFNALEKRILEAILSTDCVGALFSANLWFLLARHMSPQLLFNQLIWLCHLYNKLNSQSDVDFHNSPQRIHLSHTMSGLFQIMDVDDKLKICKQFRIHDDNNCFIWTALRINNLPAESRDKAEEVILDKLAFALRNLPESCDSDDLLNIVNLAATCSFQNKRGVDDQLVSAWSKTCQQNQTIVRGLSKDTLWFYHYVGALASLTDTLMGRLRDRSSHFIMVLHAISGLIRTGDTEMKLILTNTLCKLASCDLKEDKVLIDSHFTQSFASLLLHPDDILQNNLLIKLEEHRLKNYLDSIMNGNEENESLHQNWLNIKNRKREIGSMEIFDAKYMHKCIDNCEVQEVSRSVSVQELKDANLDDFYFDSGGSEMCVDSEIVSEPRCKRGKPNEFDADKIISSLEENALLLVMNIDYTPDQLLRIRNVYEKLQNISF